MDLDFSEIRTDSNYNKLYSTRDIPFFDFLSRKIATIFSGNSRKGSYHFEHDLSKLPNGLYLLIIKSDADEAITYKFIKK